MAPNPINSPDTNTIDLNAKVEPVMGNSALSTSDIAKMSTRIPSACEIRIARKAYSRWKRSQKKGAATIVTRYTHRGVACY